MKRTAIFLLILCCAISLRAQYIHAYAIAGAVGAQVEGDELKGFNHWGFAGGVGAIVDLDEKDMFSLSLETDYSCRGIHNHKYNYLNYYNIDVDLHYVDIPLTFFFHDPYGGLRIGAGLQYSRLLSQPHGTASFNPRYFIPDSSDMSFLKDDFAAAIEFRFDIYKGLQFSARYQYSILPVKKGWHFQMGEDVWANDCYNSALTLRLLWDFGYQERRGPAKSKRYRR